MFVFVRVCVCVCVSAYVFVGLLSWRVPNLKSERFFCKLGVSSA